MTHRKTDLSQIDPDVQAHIGRQLRTSYVDILNQPVPDRFLELLAELDRKQDPFSSDEDDDGRARNGAR